LAVGSGSLVKAKFLIIKHLRLIWQGWLSW